MASNEERVKALSQRFRNDEEPETPQKGARHRHSLYLDRALVTEADRLYKETAHRLYPTQISKSDFLEAALKIAFAHMEEIDILLTQG